MKGIAFEAVCSQLTMNGDVNTIITTLRTLFGRPEVIIKELIQEVQSMRSIKDDNLLSIMTFAMAVQNLVATITSCKLTNHLNNPSLLESLVEKLPTSLKLQWGMRSLSLVNPNIATFNSWLQEISQSARMVTNEVPKQVTNEVKSEKKGSGSGARIFLNVHTNPNEESTSSAKSDCGCCVTRGSICTSVAHCETFKNLSLKERWEIVKSKQLCRICLKPRHKKQCPQQKKCMVDGCTFKHNPLLHKKIAPVENITKENLIATQSDGGEKPSVLFKIVPVKLYGPYSSIETFAFLDDGSGLTLIDQEISDQLAIPGIKQPLCLTWTGNTSRLEEDSQVVSISISSLAGTKVYQMPEVRTVKDLALPEQTLTSDYVQSFDHLKGLPINTYKSAKPRLLIGLKDLNLGVPIKTYQGKSNQPICFLTRLGYLVFGSGDSRENIDNHSVNVHNCDCELHNLVNSFFSLESVGVVASEKSLIPSEERRATQILQDTTKKVGDKFECGLLWRFDNISFPDNLAMARKRLQCLKRKLDNDPDLKAIMHQQISEYIEKGYIRQLNDLESNNRTSRTWYLPIFSVSNPNKPNKVRIVWDAAAKCKDVSLNSMLVKGPDQLSSLLGVLQRFRQHQYAVCGDIMQMFHQIQIRKADQDSQRFLWMDTFGNELTYVMQVMTFGATCSPSCAQFVKNLNANSYAESHPRAVIGITKNHYVDDFLDSLPTEAALIKLAQDVRSIHKKGGFLIRNWISNSSVVLESLGENVCNNEKSLNISEETEIEKVLGLWWSTKDDIFTYNLRITDQNRDLLSGLVIPTKQLLSTMMKIFDPLGFLANAMIYVKIILQDVWKSGVEWDEIIHPEQFSKWKEWLKAISKVSDLAIPRWYFKTSPPQNLELHVFVDGSLQAYSSVAYFCSGIESNRHCALICAKSKVASMKLTSVPRIELMGALIGARLAKTIQDEHALTITRRVFWCDSLTVFKWIYNDRLKFKQFVGFRIGEILELSSANEWRYVPSKQNVADQATKANKLPIISSNSEWFSGPDFLMNPEEDWPSNIVNDSENTTFETTEVYIHDQLFIPHLMAIEKFSSWKRLYRVTAWIVRAFGKWRVYRRTVDKSTICLTAEEMEKAKNILIRQCQYEAFTDEMIILEKVKQGISNLKLEKSSLLYKESPYLDDNGVARRRGRIDAANAPYEVKRPILLPKKHPLTELIIQFHHESYRHANDDTVINELLQKYAIPSVRVQLKAVKRRCQKCKNDNAIPTPHP